jgi:hypothetical protein
VCVCVCVCVCARVRARVCVRDTSTCSMMYHVVHMPSVLRRVYLRALFRQVDNRQNYDEMHCGSKVEIVYPDGRWGCDLYNF